MKESITYKGTIDGVYGIYCGFKPDGLVVEEEITVYRPDKGKIFVKDNEKYSFVILKGKDKISNYQEVEKESEDDNRNNG